MAIYKKLEAKGKFEELILPPQFSGKKEKF